MRRIYVSILLVIIIGAVAAISKKYNDVRLKDRFELAANNISSDLLISTNQLTYVGGAHFGSREYTLIFKYKGNVNVITSRCKLLTERARDDMLKHLEDVIDSGSTGNKISKNKALYEYRGSSYTIIMSDSEEMLVFYFGGM